MARGRRQVQWQAFTVERDGHTYQAEYAIDQNTVTVRAWSADATPQERSTQVGASALLTARLLLRQLIAAGRVQPES